MPTFNVLMRVSLIAEACVSLRLTLELFYLVSCVALVCYCGALLNKIAQKEKIEHRVVEGCRLPSGAVSNKKPMRAPIVAPVQAVMIGIRSARASHSRR